MVSLRGVALEDDGGLYHGHPIRTSGHQAWRSCVDSASRSSPPERDVVAYGTVKKSCPCTRINGGCMGHMNVLLRRVTHRE